MADRMCKVPSCLDDVGKRGARGMCVRHYKQWRYSFRSLGLEVPPPEPRPLPAPPAEPLPTGTRMCSSEGCPNPLDAKGGRGMCRKHYKQWLYLMKRLGLALPPSPRQQRAQGGGQRKAPRPLPEGPFPEDPRAELSIDGVCSVDGCDDLVGNKGARGLCPRCYTRWKNHLKAQGLPVPPRSSGRDPRCKMPTDNELVALIREHGSYTKVASAAGVNRGSLEDFLSRRPELKARMDAEWRQVYRPKKYANDAERQAALKERKRIDARRRKLNQALAAAADLGAEDARQTFDYVLVLDQDPCSYCGGPSGEIDHIEPVSQGGSSHWSNLTAACGPCNASKGNKQLLHFLLDSYDAREARMKEHEGRMPSWSTASRPLDIAPVITLPSDASSMSLEDRPA